MYVATYSYKKVCGFSVSLPIYYIRNYAHMYLLLQQNLGTQG